MNTPWQRYVALGDSLTEGLEDTNADGSYRGWADRLAQHLADRNGAPLEYANFAIRGRLLGAILDEQVEPALALRPDLVSIWGGGNDMMRPGADPDAMTARLEEAVARFRAIGADVLVGTGIDSKDSPVLSLTRPRTAISNANLWSMARRQGAHVVDVWGMRSLRDWRMWHEDRLHLNGAGHERVSQAALVALGLEPDDPDWDTPLPPAPAMTRAERREWQYVWLRDHVRPWLGRRIRRTSSGAGRLPKHADYVLVAPQPSSAGTAQ